MQLPRASLRPPSTNSARFVQAAPAPRCHPWATTHQRRSTSHGSSRSLRAPITPPFVRSPPPSVASTSAHPRASATRSPWVTTASASSPSRWLGVNVISNLGLIVVPRDKILRASAAIADVLDRGVHFHVYRSLCGLLEHLRAVNLQSRNIMFGLYRPHGPTGASKFGPTGWVTCDPYTFLSRWVCMRADPDGKLWPRHGESNPDSQRACSLGEPSWRATPAKVGRDFSLVQS